MCTVSNPYRKNVLQQTLGPTMSCWTPHHLVSYVTFLFHCSGTTTTLYVCIIYYSSFLPSEVLTTDYLLRPGKLIKTKGAIATSFSLFGSSFLFITSHLSGILLICNYN